MFACGVRCGVELPRQTKRLTARAVQTIAEPGRHADGDGLYLVVDDAGAKRWVAFFQWQGRRREMGLGAAAYVSLALARERAREAREQAAGGVDPIAAKAAPADASTRTFGQEARELIEALEPEWVGKNTASNWRRSIELHAASLERKPVSAVTTHDVLHVLRPLWSAKPETAGKLRERIERVLDAARAKGLRQGDNPARWKGHLEHILPARARLIRGHHPAMPYEDIPAFMVRLGERLGFSARALEWTILTAARESMTLGARWSEISGDVWTIPAERMKGRKAERKVFAVPLPPRLVDQLNDLKEQQKRAAVCVKSTNLSTLIFPSVMRLGEPMSDAAMDRMLDSLAPGFTVHGFRSSFRDWAGDRTDFPEEIAEAALAHVVGSKVRRSYRRGDAFERRRKLMEAWADYCLTPPSAGAGSAPRATPQE